MVRLRFRGTDYAAAFDLPSDLVRFRFAAAATGPCSDVCVAHVAARCSVAVGQRGLRLGTEGLGGLGRVRIRGKDLKETWTTPWRSLPMELGEEEGLRRGVSYSFAMQLQTQKRRSQWSREVSATFREANLNFTEPLQVTAKSATSVSVSWPSDPQLEFRLDVFRLHNTGPEHRSSVLASGEFSCEAKIFHLEPCAEYSLELFVRCVPLGLHRWQATGLHSKFITPD